MIRRPSIWAAAAGIVAAICAVPALADTYPSRPIRLIVPYTPGQGADSAARIVADKLSEQLSQPLVVENRPGAGGNIGSEVAARAAPDGYTLLVGSNATHAANSSLYSTMRFDPLKDFVPISYIGSVAMVMLAAPDFPASDMSELVELAKAKPDEINVAVPSSSARVVLELLTTTSGTQLKDIAYKGSSSAVSDLLGGHVQLSIDTAMAATPQVSAGKLKALGVSTSKRSAMLPDIGTFAESGLTGFDLAAWNVWFAPSGTPAEIVDKLNLEIKKVLADPDVVAKLRALGYEPSGVETPQQVSAFVHSETKKWGDLIRSAGIKVE